MSDENWYEVLIGDCIDGMRTLPDASVHCCVTSPPYFGLRDYGKDGQIGLEDTPEAYVARLVEVFREVKRVLRDDGTLWVNLGSSYASRDIPASPSRLPQRVDSCGTYGRAQEDFQATGCACHDPDGAHQDDSPIRRGRSADKNQCGHATASPRAQTARDSAIQGYVAASLVASTRAAPASSSLASSARVPAACALSSAASAFPQSQQTFAADGRPFVYTSACSHDTSEPLGASVVRIQDTKASVRACSCGSCGVCWAYLAIPSLRIKAKDLISIPQLVAFALQADGWYLRQEIIWSKPNPMPESVRDRFTKAHEQIFLLSKSPRYYFDQEAVKEPVSEDMARRAAAGHTRGQGKVDASRRDAGTVRPTLIEGSTRNRRSVWTVTTKPYSGAHFATFPPDLIEPCILAGAPVGGVVLDPFGGSGTTAGVALKHGRNAILCELNPDYDAMIDARVDSIRFGKKTKTRA